MARRRNRRSKSAQAQAVAATSRTVLAPPRGEGVAKPKRPTFDPAKGEQVAWHGLLGAAAALGLSSYIALQNSFTVDGVKLLLIWSTLGIGAFLFFLELPKHRYRSRQAAPWKWVWRAAAARYVGGLLVLALWTSAYLLLQVYSTAWYGRYWLIFRVLASIYIVGGFPYALLTMRYRYDRGKDLRDASLLPLIVVRILFQRRHVRKRIRRALGGMGARVTMLGIVVKAFFLPLMSIFLFNTSMDYTRALRILIFTPGQGWVLWDQWFNVLFNSIFLMDVSLAWLGYTISSRWIDNGIRSTERTTFGWAVCVLCYPPMNDLMTWYFVWPSMKAVGGPETIWRAASQVMAIGLLGIYLWATTAFGLRFSNLTHRGIITRGPYRWVRHPAYVAKGLGWWFEHIPSFVSPTAASLRAAWFMLCWNFIYYLRARTEEKHLGLDPNYRAYAERVRWKFIPGIW